MTARRGGGVIAWAARSQLVAMVRYSPEPRISRRQKRCSFPNYRFAHPWPEKPSSQFIFVRVVSRGREKTSVHHALLCCCWQCPSPRPASNASTTNRCKGCREFVLLGSSLSRQDHHHGCDRPELVAGRCVSRLLDVGQHMAHPCKRRRRNTSHGFCGLRCRNGVVPGRKEHRLRSWQRTGSRHSAGYTRQADDCRCWQRIGEGDGAGPPVHRYTVLVA